jgi:glycerol-3-phosphate dehydrogenase
MWDFGWRDRVWTSLDNDWDIVIIGGGITGAGILREASRAGLRALLVEGHDFASGTSSRSSKLVHGGFRYLQNAQIRLTLQSVRERERLLKDGRGLVGPLGFLLASYRGNRTPGWVFGAGLAVYDLLAFKWGHRYYDALDMKELCPPLCESGLKGGYRFFDAQTDDARLVLRVIREGVRSGGLALNYARAADLLKLRNGTVEGIVLEDCARAGHGRTAEVRARMVINAAGAWSDALRTQVGGLPRLRKLRGSHLILPLDRLPLSRAVSIQHPRDGRFMFAFPWEGVALVGTTDVDHRQPLETDPSTSPDEVEYMLEALDRIFPDQEIEPQDIQATFAGVRPVVNTGKADPSKEAREHVIWCENGLLTVTGGKLTTFRLMAQDALRSACRRLPGQPKFDPDWQILDAPPPETVFEDAETPLKPAARLRLLGRYGSDAPAVVHCARPGELEPIAATPCRWAELRWAARQEGVIHLDDLLLRRVRLGLLLPEGGQAQLERIRAIVQAELGWDDACWEQEADRYKRLWRDRYSIHS